MTKVLSSIFVVMLAAAPAAAAPRPRPARTSKPAPAPAPAPAPSDTPEEPVLQRSNRMELDARVVRGETARSGAVYLFQRAPRRLPPLVGLHQSYLDEIVVPVLGADALAPVESIESVESVAPVAPVPVQAPATAPPAPKRGGR